MVEHVKRGRPREYDATQALTAALGEFWKRGYTATSLDHLSEATKMGRPSLYAAFGNKIEIYRKAVRQYAEEWSRRRECTLINEPSLRKGLENYFTAIIETYVSSEGEPLGCPVFSIISGEAATEPQLRAELAATLEKADSQFQRRIKMAVEAGELSADTDIAGIVTSLAALQHTLALRARSGENRSKLTEIAFSQIALVLKMAGSKHRCKAR